MPVRLDVREAKEERDGRVLRRRAEVRAFLALEPSGVAEWAETAPIREILKTLALVVWGSENPMSRKR